VGWCAVSATAEIGPRLSGSAVHLLAAGELFRQGYGGSTPVAVCGEPVGSGAGDAEDPRYCPDCVREAIRWCAQPVAARGDAS
jgi:hypothetical protein